MESHELQTGVKTKKCRLPFGIYICLYLLLTLARLTNVTFDIAFFVL